MKRTLICLATLSLAVLPLPAQDVPELINYQGLLSDASGDPLPTGSHDLVFNIYEDPDGTSLIWGPEVHEEAQVVQGRFNVILGSTVPLEQAFSEADRWLGVAVSPEAEISPRQRVLSAPFAMTAHNGVPIGGLIMWWGDTATVPSGWQICDGSPITVGPLAGTNTPNLTDRLIQGQGAGDSTVSDLNAAGSSSVGLNLANLPNHAHDIHDAFLLEAQSYVDQRFDQDNPPSNDFLEPYFGHENTPIDQILPLPNPFWGNSGTDADNNTFVYRSVQTTGSPGASATPITLPEPPHQEVFIIIRIL